MDTQKFLEVVSQTPLPFVYSGERLGEEKCKQVLKKIGDENGVLAVITGDLLIGVSGMAILESGIKFSLPSASTGEMKVPKTKGEFSFDKFLIHQVSVKTFLQAKLDVVMLVWDTTKGKSFNFQFSLAEDNTSLDAATVEALTKILSTLVSKTGTEFVSASSGDAKGSVDGKVKNPNEFDFVWYSTHTTIVLNDDNIVIRKTKIDDKTKIQTPKGEPVTISRSAIGSVKIKRSFSPLPLLSGMAVGAVIGFVIFGGVVVLLIGTVLGLIGAFTKTMYIFRKDGTKYKTVISGDEENTNEYDRLINVIFK